MKTTWLPRSFVAALMGPALAVSLAVPPLLSAEDVYHSPFFPAAVTPLAVPALGDPDSQTLADLAAKRRAAIDAALALPNRDVLLGQIGAAEVEALEGFVEAHPNSPWTPSLRASLGRYQRDRGRYTLALKHWEAAWRATGEADSGPAREIAEYTLVHWTRLLASLGRVEQLAPLYLEHRDRVFAAGNVAQVWTRTREAYTHMVRQPDIAYKCGVYALNHVARTLYGTNVLALLRQPSPLGGFSLATLWSLSDAQGLGLVPAVRGPNSELVVPCLVHWTQNHYAAIVARHGDMYEVVDPAFGGRQMMDAQTVNAEASGVFMVPAAALRAGWRALNRSDADRKSVV